MKLIRGAIVRTEDLFAAIDIHGKIRKSDNEFKYIDFDTLKNNGFAIWIFK